MKLDYFLNDTPLVKAVKDFFSAELDIELKGKQDQALVATTIFGKDFKHLSLIDKVYFTGGISDDTFNKEGEETDWENLNKKTKYKALFVFAVDLNDPKPTRTLLSDVVRRFNRISEGAPVVVVFRYSGKISWASCERVDKIKGTGEKIGKVSLLRDISISTPHRGHLDILSRLKIQTTGSSAIKSYQQLYYFWLSVFSISVLNKKFYEEIIGWFNTAIKEIKIPSAEKGSEKHKDFTVRLIARLIFIWFLKELKVIKEELLLVEINGLDNDLIKPKTEGSSYYKFVLQNLFFNALNSEQASRDKKFCFWYEGDFVGQKKIRELIDFSPYLNGGLFDIHKNDWFDEEKPVNAFVVPDEIFLDKTSGLNSLLARYKFTIAENTPTEEEIAVDPEMLGRIFENLLAEQSDDTKEAARKNTGAFYTPRPVVSYMCRKTLLDHLSTDIKPENGKAIIKKLLTTTVLDPACGSGAFPMGMLEEMMQVLDHVDPEGNLWVAEMLKSKDQGFLEHISDFIADKQTRYVKKLGLLRNCLFGIDLLDYAVEITKLRCWLSLIVDQKVDFAKPNFNLKPLPNLEFKFYAKNSLLRHYKKENLNILIESIDSDKLLEELYNLENEYFITKSDHVGTKEKIKQRIIDLLQKLVDEKSNRVEKDRKLAQSKFNHLISSKAREVEIKKAQKIVAKLAEELAELAHFRETIKNYFIERVVFPGIFSKKIENPGFDIVIGNPPYVNTKLINKMKMSEKLEEEYGYCDDLYNHFTMRGLELLKHGGILSYITSDTFLTLQTKKNMRLRFLGLADKIGERDQIDLFGNSLATQVPAQQQDMFGAPKAVQIELVPVKSDSLKKQPKEKLDSNACRITEIINTPKAFAALVDTAIFSLKKEQCLKESSIVYVDIRKPNADTFSITEEEWKQIKTGKENLAGWERVLDKTFSALGHHAPAWKTSHTCDGDQVHLDSNSPLLKYKLSFEPYRKSINYAIFSPTPYNCQILEKIVNPARPVFDSWWSKIETSRQIESNRKAIDNFNKKIKPGDWSIIGLVTDGGVGLQTGDNGRFVGYKSSSRFAERCKVTRVQKLWAALEDEPKIRGSHTVLSKCKTEGEIRLVLDKLKEEDVWELFDSIKEKYGLRIFGKGYMYRIIPDKLVCDVGELTDKQREHGIKNKRCFVPYDKGDKEGNRWYAETPYLIDWSEEAVSVLSTDEKARWQGYQFFFRNGFCWSDVLNPNSQYIKCRLKGETVNDVKSMSLYESIGLGEEYLVSLINSYLSFKLLREFLNSSVAIQINDIRKLPIKIPSKAELAEFKELFDKCVKVKRKYFNEELDRAETNQLLRPIELEIDQLVNKLYGIDVHEEIVEELEEEVVVGDEEEEEDD
jgi:hypothetical protein